MTSLFHIAAEYREQAAALANLDLPPEVVADTLEGMAGEVEDKAIACAHVVRALEADAAAERKWAKDAMERAKSIEARAERLRENIADNLHACNIISCKAPGLSLSFRKSEAVIIDNPELLPPELFSAPRPPEPDKTAIKEAIKAGQEVAGARIEQRTSLQIR